MPIGPEALPEVAWGTIIAVLFGLGGGVFAIYILVDEVVENGVSLEVLQEVSILMIILLFLVLMVVDSALVPNPAGDELVFAITAGIIALFISAFILTFYGIVDHYVGGGDD